MYDKTNVAVELTSLSFVLLELLVDGCDGVQQHFDFLHTAETLSVTHRFIYYTGSEGSLHVNNLLPVLRVCPHLLRPAVGQQTSLEELALDVLCRSFNGLQRTGDLHTHAMSTVKHRAPTAARSEHFNQPSCVHPNVLETAVCRPTNNLKNCLSIYILMPERLYLIP